MQEFKIMDAIIGFPPAHGIGTYDHFAQWKSEEFLYLRKCFILI